MRTTIIAISYTKTKIRLAATPKKTGSTRTCACNARASRDRRSASPDDRATDRDAKEEHYGGGEEVRDHVQGQALRAVDAISA